MNAQLQLAIMTVPGNLFLSVSETESNLSQTSHVLNVDLGVVVCSDSLDCK